MRRRWWGAQQLLAYDPPQHKWWHPDLKPDSRLGDLPYSSRPQHGADTLCPELPALSDTRAPWALGHFPRGFCHLGGLSWAL